MSLPIEIRQLYKQHGPFATVYLDGSRDTEQGEREVELRWRALREQLAQAGAESAVLDQLEASLDTDREAGGRHGHLVVASSEGVLLDEVTDEPPLRPLASWAPLPHLLPFLARGAEVVPHVVVIADRTGANMYANEGYSRLQLDRGEPAEVTGPDQHPVHKTGRNDWSERHFQNRVDNTWSENAADVAEAVHRQVSEIGARVVVVAGDVRARSLLLHALADELPATVDVVETAAGGRASGAALEPVQLAAHDAVLRVRWRDRREILAKLRQGVGRSDLGTVGIDNALEALRKGQVETLVISDDPSSTERAWMGPEPLQLARTERELHDMGVREPFADRLDAGLVRAVAGSGADLLITPNAHSYLAEGVGAVLRYPLTADELQEQ